jgi:hypothetical protein
MREFVGKNLSSLVPLTPLNPDEPCVYVECNLTNRVVHPDSILERCQESQIVFDGEDVYRVGKGVKGEVTAADVQAVRDGIGGVG